MQWYHRRGRRDDAREQALLAVRRKRHLEGVLLGHGGERVELELDRFGAGALWISSTLGLAAFAALLGLPKPATVPDAASVAPVAGY